MSEQENWNSLRNKIIGLGDQSGHKSYFPELQKKIKELEEREANLFTLLNSTLDAIIILDEHGSLFDVNVSMINMYQIPNKEIALSYSFTDYSSSVKADFIDQIISDTLQGDPQLFEWKARRPITDELFDAEIAFHATHWHQKPAIIATVRDISFRKQIEQQLLEREYILTQQNEELRTLNDELAESNYQVVKINEQLRKANQKAIESDKLKSAFLANMSHEIRTPMNGIIGFASLLTTDNDQESIHQYVSIINNCSHQLLTIIDDIIDISKIEAGQITLNPRKVHLNNLLNEVFIYYQTKINKSVILNIKNELPDDKCNIIVDSDRLRQIINNLMNNAIKFTHQGSICMGYNVNQNHIKFYVTDTGIGISPKDKKLIFKRFRQAEPAKTAIYGGTGLGLSISKALISLMGGEIRVKSQIDKGATFHFTLPLIFAND